VLPSFDGITARKRSLHPSFNPCPASLLAQAVLSDFGNIAKRRALIPRARSGEAIDKGRMAIELLWKQLNPLQGLSGQTTFESTHFAQKLVYLKSRSDWFDINAIAADSFHITVRDIAATA
jgi:hypothetical protein